MMVCGHLQAQMFSFHTRQLQEAIYVTNEVPY